MNPKLLCLLFLLFPVFPTGEGALHAQTEPGPVGRLDREKWKLLTEDLNYPVPAAFVEEEVLEEDPEETNRWLLFFKILAVLFVVGVMAFVIRQLMSGEGFFRPRNRKFDKGLQIKLEQIEANLPDANIPDFVQEALQAGDYKMAVRLHYLGLIQLLAQKQWIDWKREKTNGDYLREVRTRPVYEGFREATLVFERIWYGDRRLGANAYRKIAAQFADLQQIIKTS
ncbi:MAG: DUF4129 domain-containing protein [Saprospirales bacterium]|nr:DUF4129 domain-containing protein [Saprospirales bacterium]